MTAAASIPDLTGCIVDDRHELVQLLGAGTYGVVYKALDTHSSSSDSPLYRAIKIIRKAGRRLVELTAVHREVGLQSLVSSHPGVISILDAYDDNDYFYIILDFCPGGDLFEKIVDHKLYQGNDALVKQAFVSLIDSVHACHNAKIAHRDLKPENVLTSKDGSQTFLADFGMATQKRTIEDFNVGTSIYMSPECIGELYGYMPYCARTSDIWALGIILINMLSGRNPWQKPSLKDPGFKGFVKHSDFLFDMLPISSGAHDILRRILTLNPLKRITLPALRRAILSLDTFFRPEDEEAEADSSDTAAEAESQGKPATAEPAQQQQQRQPGAPKAVAPLEGDDDDDVWDPSTPVAKAKSTLAGLGISTAFAFAAAAPDPPAPLPQSSSASRESGAAAGQPRPPRPPSSPSPALSARSSSGPSSSFGSCASSDSSANSSLVGTPEGSTAGLPCIAPSRSEDIVDYEWEASVWALTKGALQVGGIDWNPKKGSAAQLRYKVFNTPETRCA